MRTLAAPLLALALSSVAAAQAPPPGWLVEETPLVVLERVEGSSGPEADRALALFARCAAQVEEKLGVPVPPRPRVVLAPTDAAFARRVAAVAGGATHGRALAVAFPARRLVVVRQPGLVEGTSASLERALRHELAHLALGADPGAPTPRWLEEGLAELASGRRLDEGERGMLAARARLGSLPTLGELDRTIEEEGPGAADAYTTSLAFVTWLGFGDATTLVRALREPGATLDGALERTCGRPLAEADAAWRVDLAGSGAWWGALLAVSPWSLVGVLALVAIGRHLVVRGRLRRALDAAEAGQAKPVEEVAPPGQPG